jgi:hypothetical protein
MRFLLASLVLVAVAGVPDPLQAGGRTTRCCLELGIPELPPGPICAQVRGRRRIGPRRACRLLGGRPIGRGACSLAVCRAA